MQRRRFLKTLALGAAATLQPAAFAQTAANALRVIVPTPAGGPSDAAARRLMQALGHDSGRQVVIDNRPGAGGAIAARAVLDARGDPHTLLWALGSMSGIPVLQKSPPYPSLEVFVPVSNVGRFVFALFVAADVPARSVAELVALLRDKPDALACAHGTLGEWMAAAQVFKATGTRATMVPYKGGAQLMPDLASGRVQVNFGPLSSGLAQVQAGRVRALAVLAGQRSPLLPEVPTLAEAGIATGPLPTWQALLAAPASPPEMARTLSRQVATALQDAELRGALQRLGLQVEGSTPEALTQTLSADAQVWRQFVAEQQIAPE
jgi:tripartite-type tricarboxylate transporter receptor subunit TctC